MNKNLINMIVQRIVDTLDPQAVFLFGSYAWGSPNKDSDIDLLVLVAAHNESRVQLSTKVFKALREYSYMPIDLIFRTVDEFDQYSNVSGTLNYKILNHGEKLYDRFAI